MRLGAVRAVCRVLLVAGAGATALAPAMAPAGSAPAATPTQGAPADPVAEAEQRVIEAKNEANAAAARYTEAQSRYEQLGDQILLIEDKINAGITRAEQLREIAQRRAVVVYKTQGVDMSAVLHSNNPREGLRSTVLLDKANAADNQAFAELAAVTDDLAVHRDRLDSERELQREALDQLTEERKLLDAKIADAEQARLNLDAKLQAAAAAAPQSFDTAVNAPVIDGLVCPVPGAAFSNDFGQPRSGGRSHEGNDMFAPIGTANLAVVGGNVTFGDGGAGGMGAYLDGDNGVTYVYYHLSEYVGGPRQVSQGEVIGKVGQTGNASAPHTHFEIRPGGRTAGAINPYSTLTKIC